MAKQLLSLKTMAGKPLKWTRTTYGVHVARRTNPTAMPAYNNYRIEHPAPNRWETYCNGVLLGVGETIAAAKHAAQAHADDLYTTGRRV